jgi:hypothetical protein
MIKCNVIITNSGEIEYQFELKYGRSRVLPNGLKLGFKELLSESRCPIGVVCVWEGKADISLWMLKSGLDTVSFQLQIYGYVDKTNTARHKYIDTLGYLSLLDYGHNENQDNCLRWTNGH